MARKGDEDTLFTLELWYTNIYGGAVSVKTWEFYLGEEKEIAIQVHKFLKKRRDRLGTKQRNSRGSLTR